MTRIFSLFSVAALLASPTTFAESLPCVIDCAGKPADIIIPGLTGSTGDLGITGSTGTTSPNVDVPKPTGPDIGGFLNNHAGDIVENIITLGGKVWDFVISNKPTASYDSLKTSAVPDGVTSFAQLSGWSRPVRKTFHIGFKTITGADAGGFDYRITYMYGGSYQGKGKYIGELTVNPANIKLHTDRSVKIHTEALAPINMGTPTDPIAALHLIVTWASPTTTRFVGGSAEYFIMGNGEIIDLNTDN